MLCENDGLIESVSAVVGLYFIDSQYPLKLPPHESVSFSNEVSNEIFFRLSLPMPAL